MNRLTPFVLALALAGCVVPPSNPTTPEASPTPAAPLTLLPSGNQPAAGSLGSLRNAGPASTTMNVGEKRALPPLFLDAKGLVPTTGVVWTSSADGVVGVNPTTGDAVATAKGTAVITVALQADPSVKAQITINVGDKGDVTALEVTPPQTTVAIGESAPLLAKVTLGTGEVRSDVLWSSSDDKIATVDSKGTVTGKAVGTVQILAAYAGNQSFKGQAAVRVTATKGTTTATPTPAATTDAGPDTVALRPEGAWTDAGSATGNFTAMKFVDQKAGILAGPDALATTADGGLTWTSHPNGLTGVHKAFISGNEAWFLTTGAIYASTDGSAFPLVVDFKATYGEELADVSRTGATDALAITATGKLYKSADAGKTWSAVAGTPAQRQLLVNFTSSTTWGPVALAPGGGLHYAHYFEETCKVNSASYYQCMFPDAYSNPDGAGWVKTTPSKQVQTMLFTTAKEGWRLLTLGTLERTVDGGKSWLYVAGAQGQAMTFLDDQQGVVLSGNTYYVTENDGRSWRSTKFDSTFYANAMAVLDLDHMWALGNGKVKRYQPK